MKLRILSIVAALAVLLPAMGAEAPKYVFYFIGDGMGMAQSLAAQVYNRTVRGNEEPILMMRFPIASMSTTHSASSPVTDSAAAGTALATGNKTKNGMLGMNPDTVAVTSLARELFDKGYGVALVTSVPPDDATPGAFYAHVPNRGMYYEIGKQMAESGYDFIAGSNLRGLKDKEGRETDLLSQFEKNGVAVARGLDQLEALPAGKALLLNPEGIDYHQIHFTIDSVKGAMNLPDMTRAALDRMEKNGRERFFMMVEGGNIDYGGHANDGGTIIKEVLNFNQALQHAYDFYLAHPDETLIVVTADHETGGMGLGNNTVGYDLHLEYIDHQRISKDAFAEFCRATRSSRRIFDWADMKEFLTENLGFWNGVPVTPEQESRLMAEFERAFKGDIPADKKTLYNSFSNFTEEVYKIMDSVTGLGWTTNGHSGGLVPVFAVGVGAEEFAPLTDNISIPAKLRKITGVD
ncbi:MAG: alkaline phosphatase [Muribaculaceae bacterium]|nr:alkaline phosphatase [Muribaculaceae bacterium]